MHYRDDSLLPVLPTGATQPERGRRRGALAGLIAGLMVGLVVLGSGCRLAPHQATVPYEAPASAGAPAPATWSEVLAHPVRVEVETIVAAEWAVPRKGVINLKHPEVAAAGLDRGEHPIVLATHLVRHPTAGDFLIDTGIDRGMADGDPPAMKGLVRAYVRDIEPRVSVDALRRERDLHLRGVLLTHAHLDHVLGLPDIPAETPIYTGPAELGARRLGQGILLRRTYRALFDDRVPVRELHPQLEIEGIGAVDLLGDGSIWALSTPGHTPGSLAFLVNADDGPVLFTGDTSHTRWGWDHGVEPGGFTDDARRNRESLHALKRLARSNPQVRVVVGHELGRGWRPTPEVVTR